MTPNREPTALEKLEQLEREQAEAEARRRNEVRTGALPAQPPPLEAPLPPRTAPKKKGPIATALGALVLALSKLKFVLGAMKFGAFFKTGLTMMLSIGAYAMAYGWAFAALFVGLIFVHEMGHAIAARALGLPVSAPTFIPFFGAYVTLKELPKTSYQQFIVSTGGPLLGAIASAACIYAASLLGDPHTADMFRAAGFYGLVINLFNLLPFGYFDGAKMVTPVRPWSGVFGTAFLGAVLLFFSSEAGYINPFAVIVVLAAAFRFLGRAMGARSRAAAGGSSTIDLVESPYSDEATVTDDQRATASWTYFALCAALIAAVHVAHKVLPTLAQ